MSKKLSPEQQKQNNKRLLIVLACCFGSMLLLMGLNSINFDIDISSWFEEEEEPIYYYLYEPDWESNIYENEEYMAKDRYINYTEGPMTTIITPENNEFGELGEFFLAYFRALTDGDAQTFNTFFTPSFFEDDEDNQPWERFTMQKIHNIHIELTSKHIFEEESEYFGLTRYTFLFSYHIMRNDGTFRRDMPSDGAVPQVVEVIYDGRDYKINSIIKRTEIK